MERGKPKVAVSLRWVSLSLPHLQSCSSEILLGGEEGHKTDSSKALPSKNGLYLKQCGKFKLKAALKVSGGWVVSKLEEAGASISATS